MWMDWLLGKNVNYLFCNFQLIIVDYKEYLRNTSLASKAKTNGT